MLDHNHVEKRIRIAAAQPYPTREIYRLIDECDWRNLGTINLGTMLIDDRKLAITQCGQKPLDPKFDNQHFCKIALRKMDEVRDRYFSELSSQSIYTTSKHTKDRSARKAAGLPLSPEPGRGHEGNWASATAKDAYSKVISSLGLETGTGPGPIVHFGYLDGSPKYSKNSTTRLLSSKEKWD